MNCPDGKLLSACADGEVPSPWKERIERHAASCPDCSRSLDAYKALSAGLNRDLARNEGAAIQAASRRIAENLGLDQLPSVFAAAAETRGPNFGPGSKRGMRVSSGVFAGNYGLHIPLPLAVAALALILFGAGLAIGRFGGKRENMNLAATQKVLASQAGTIEELVKYLDSQGSSQAVTIRLPSEASFSSPVDPVLMTTSSGGVTTPTSVSQPEVQK